VSPVRAIPTSRAYWELRAEQVLNRVFAPEAPIDVEVCESPGNPGDASTSNAAASRTAASGTATSNTAATAAVRATTAQGRSARPAPAQRPGAAHRPPTPSAVPHLGSWWKHMGHQPTLLLVAASGLVTVTAGTTLLGLSLWQQSQQAIRQERNMLLVERLRAMGPAAAASQPATGAANTSSGGATATLPPADPNQLPPPPTEPWMEELASLPASSAPPANVLRVPMNERVGSPAPPASGRPTGSGPRPGGAAPAPAPAAGLPQLVGVVQVPGRPGSAIFQMDGSSTSAAAGESIGSSGWRLQSASGDSAVIERNGVQQRISISSGL
jgi:hypothetical protein